MLNRLPSVSALEDPMAIVVSKTRAQRASVAITLPADVARGLPVTSGQESEWIEDGMSGFRVVPPLPRDWRSAGSARETPRRIRS